MSDQKSTCSNVSKPFSDLQATLNEHSVVSKLLILEDDGASITNAMRHELSENAPDGRSGPSAAAPWVPRGRFVSRLSRRIMGAYRLLFFRNRD